MKLLVVEDEHRLATLLKKGLENRGYAVDMLGDGRQAIHRVLLYRDAYDLIILDLMLPGESGHEVCDRLRRERISTPILVLSARAEAEDKIELLNSGADDYLTKPFSFGELEARITALLRRPQNTVVRELASPAGDIRIQPAQHAAYVFDTQLDLTLKEYMLLEYLLRNAERVITRDELLEHAWDFEYLAFSNVIDVHVKNLRKKLTRAKSTTSIETVRGVGYRVVG